VTVLEREPCGCEHTAVDGRRALVLCPRHGDAWGAMVGTVTGLAVEPVSGSPAPAHHGTAPRAADGLLDGTQGNHGPQAEAG
jgi:hypothetical protein